MQADLRVDKWFLTSSDPVNLHIQVHIDSATHQGKANGAVNMMSCRRSHDTDTTPTGVDLRADGRKLGAGAVKLQQGQPPRRTSQVVHPGDGLLTAVTPLVEMGTVQADLVGDGALVRVDADTRNPSGDAQRLPCQHTDLFDLVGGGSIRREDDFVSTVGVVTREANQRTVMSGRRTTSTRIMKRIESSQATRSAPRPGSVQPQKVSPSSTPCMTCST